MDSRVCYQIKAISLWLYLSIYLHLLNGNILHLLWNLTAIPLSKFDYSWYCRCRSCFLLSSQTFWTNFLVHLCRLSECFGQDRCSHWPESNLSPYRFPSSLFNEALPKFQWFQEKLIRSLLKSLKEIDTTFVCWSDPWFRLQKYNLSRALVWVQQDRSVHIR